MTHVEVLFFTAHSVDGFDGSNARSLTSRPSGPVEAMKAQTFSAMVTSSPPGRDRVPAGAEPVPDGASAERR